MPIPSLFLSHQRFRALNNSLKHGVTNSGFPDPIALYKAPPRPTASPIPLRFLGDGADGGVSRASGDDAEEGGYCVGDDGGGEAEEEGGVEGVRGGDEVRGHEAPHEGPGEGGREGG